MKKILLLLMLIFGFSSAIFAEVSIPDGAIYSDDGTRWAYVDSSVNPQVLMIDGVKTVSYASISSPVFIGNSSFVTANDDSGNTIMIKDGKVVDIGKTLSFLYDYTNNSKIEGWYTVDKGVFRLKDLSGNTIIENKNAGSYSYVTYIGSGVTISVIYNRNNEKAVSYINSTPLEGTLSSMGTYKKGKKTEFLLINSTSTYKTEIYAYDPVSQKLRKFPAYDGIQTYAVTTGKSGNILDLQYSVMIDDEYAFADINGNLVSESRYESVGGITAYGNKIFKSFEKDGDTYFYFDGKIYGGYDEVDTLNVTYNSDYNKVKNWSIFVKKNGKNIIIANGKEFSL